LLYPMTADELESRVEESMAEFKEGRVKSSKELLKKYGHVSFEPRNIIFD